MIKSNKENNYLKINKNFEIQTFKFFKKEKRITDKRMLNYYNLGIYLITPLLLGVFIGYQFDQWLKTKHIFILMFILFGTIASFYNLWNLTKE